MSEETQRTACYRKQLAAESSIANGDSAFLVRLYTPSLYAAVIDISLDSGHSLISGEGRLGAGRNNLGFDTA